MPQRGTAMKGENDELDKHQVSYGVLDSDNDPEPTLSWDMEYCTAYIK